MCRPFLAKVRAAMNRGGRVAILAMVAMSH
jgi:hypothetical protein